MQGDITSPLYFILALDKILRDHDSRRDKGVTLGQAIIHTLGYADDAALVDKGDDEGICTATERLNEVATGSENDADMKINKNKTKVMHVRAQDPITETTSEEATQVCKFTCPHLGCGYKFKSKRGMLTHAGKCKWSNEYKVERILACRGKPWARQYKIRWDGYSEK